LRRKGRKQRVVLRSRQRVALNRRMTFLMMGIGLLAVTGVFGNLVARANPSWGPSFIQRHTPILDIQSPDTLADLAIVKEQPMTSFILWMPGAEWKLRRQWMKEYPALGGVRFDKQFLNNRIIVRLEPRVPLVRWQERGVDKLGMTFAFTPERWPPVPKANIASAKSLPIVGRWLGEVSRVPDLWNGVVAVSEDQRGEMWLDMQTGAHVAWGTPDVKNAQEKARYLAKVLADAHVRLHGAATADMRFFSEGRVIVKPKSAI
jgi:hypothetical protein